MYHMLESCLARGHVAYLSYSKRKLVFSALMQIVVCYEDTVQNIVLVLRLFSLFDICKKKLNMDVFPQNLTQS